MNEQKSKIYLPDPNGYVRISHKLGNEIKDEKSGSDRFLSENMMNQSLQQKKKRYIFKVGDWECPNPECKNKNFAKRVKCNRCGTLKPESTYFQNLKEGHFEHRSKYKEKDKSRERERRHHRHTKRSSSSSRSRSRSISRSRSRERRRSPDRKKLTFQNRGYLGGPPGLFKEGDWKCNNCQNINFGWRTLCNKCHISKNDSDKINNNNYNRNRIGNNNNKERREYNNNINYSNYHNNNNRNRDRDSNYRKRKDHKKYRNKKDYSKSSKSSSSSSSSSRRKSSSNDSRRYSRSSSSRSRRSNSMSNYSRSESRSSRSPSSNSLSRSDKKSKEKKSNNETLHINNINNNI